MSLATAATRATGTALWSLAGGKGLAAASNALMHTSTLTEVKAKAAQALAPASPGARAGAMAPGGIWFPEIAIGDPEMNSVDSRRVFGTVLLPGSAGRRVVAPRNEFSSTSATLRQQTSDSF